MSVSSSYGCTGTGKEAISNGMPAAGVMVAFEAGGARELQDGGQKQSYSQSA